MNAAIRALVRRVLKQGIEVYGARHSYSVDEFEKDEVDCNIFRFGVPTAKYKIIERTQRIGSHRGMLIGKADYRYPLTSKASLELFF